MTLRSRQTPEGLSIRAAVFLGFGLIIGLWSFAWFELSLRLHEAQHRAAAVNARYIAAQDGLSNLRTQVLTGSVLLRDALLEPDAGKIADDKLQLAALYHDIDKLLANYVQVSDSAESRTKLSQLRQEIGAYRATMLEVLDTDSSRWRDEAHSLLTQRLTPKRDIVLAVSDSVQSLNRAVYVERQNEIASVYGSLQRELWLLLGLALIICIAVAMLAIAYAGRLEHRIRGQMTKDFELARDLQRLSEKLVTAQEQERRKIARELHDEVGQALTAVKVELAYAQNSVDGHGGPAGLLHDARAITDGALQQVRDLSYLLHPAALDELGLPAAVDSFVKRFGKRSGIDVSLVHRGMDQRLSPEIETAAYRIIQEALTNVARHSAATNCRVELVHTAGTLKLSVEDNGQGFNPAALGVREHGLGLIGIRERAFQLHGTALLDSRPGAGTRLVVEVPARRRMDQDDFETTPDPTAA